jgi:rhodanese-related sulfurtransferase
VVVEERRGGGRPEDIHVPGRTRHNFKFYNRWLLRTPFNVRWVRHPAGTPHRTPTQAIRVQFLIDNWFLIAMALVSGALLLQPMIMGAATGGGVSPAEAVRLINREKAVLIDVREPAEYASGHPGNAKNIPLAGLEASSDLPKNKSLPLVVLCQSGARSSRAVATLQKLGYANAQSLAGGLAAWREANLPVESQA